MQVDNTGTMAGEAAVAATNFWNPIGWAAAAVLIIEVIAVVVILDSAADVIANSEEYISSPEITYNRSSKKSKAASQQVSVSAGAASPPPPNGKDPKRSPLYSGKTLYNKNGVRVDYEYNGNGTGNVHIQTSAGKFYFDSSTGVMRVGLSSTSALAPANIQDLLLVPGVIKAIYRGLQYLESLGGLG